MGTENLNPHALVTKTLPRVAAEMAILAYNMTRILGIMAFDYFWKGIALVNMRPVVATAPIFGRFDTAKTRRFRSWHHNIVSAVRERADIDVKGSGSIDRVLPHEAGFAPKASHHTPSKCPAPCNRA